MKISDYFTIVNVYIKGGFYTSDMSNIFCQVDIIRKGIFVYSTDFDIENGIVKTQTCYLFKKNLK